MQVVYSPLHLGHDVTHVPLVAVEPLGDDPVDVEGYDWVVLTSPNGARELRRRMRGTPARVAAIGAATADAFGARRFTARRSSVHCSVARASVPGLALAPAPGTSPAPASARPGRRARCRSSRSRARCARWYLPRVP